MLACEFICFVYNNSRFRFHLESQLIFWLTRARWIYKICVGLGAAQAEMDVLMSSTTRHNGEGSEIENLKGLLKAAIGRGDVREAQRLQRAIGQKRRHRPLGLHIAHNVFVGHSCSHSVTHAPHCLTTCDRGSYFDRYYAYWVGRVRLGINWRVDGECQIWVNLLCRNEGKW